MARFDTRRIGCGNSASERIVDVCLGFREVARRDRAREDAVLGVVGRGGRRIGADAAAGLLSLLSCRHAQRHIHCDIFTGVSPSLTPTGVSPSRTPKFGE